MRNHWLIPEGTAAGVTVTAAADGSFSIVGTATDEAGISISIFTLEPGGKYTASTNTLISTNGSSSEGCLAVQFYKDGSRVKFYNFAHSQATQTVAITAPSEFDYAACMVYTGGAGNEFNVTGVKVMLNDGTTAAPWEPGGEVAPIQTGYGFKVGALSLSDFGQVIASRSIGSPSKKLITKTLPHMSGFYDFSNLYGSIPYESREVSYTVDIIGTREDTQQQRSELLTWLSTIHDEDIYDEDLIGWHFRGSFSAADWSEGESGENGTLTITFLCQPFIIADEDTVQQLQEGESTVTNEGQTTSVIAVSQSASQIILGGITQSVNTTPQTLSAQLVAGDNVIKVTGADVTLKWREMRL